MNHSPTRTSPKVLWILWAAFLAAPIFYTVMGWIVTSPKEAAPFPMPMTAVFAMLAVATVGLGFILPGVTMKQRLAEDAEVAPLDLYQTAMIVRWACFEAVAIYGFVLTIMCYQFLAVLVGAVVAVALIAGSRPEPPVSET